MHDVLMRLGNPVNKKHWERDMDPLQKMRLLVTANVCGIIPNLCFY